MRRSVIASGSEAIPTSMRRHFTVGIAAVGVFALLALPAFAVESARAPSGPAADSITGRLNAIATNAGYRTGKDADVKLATYVGRIINIAMGLLGVIFVAQMVYAGYLWMTARDEADQLEKAKHIIRRSIVGLAIVLGAWAIAAFVITRFSEAARV